MSVENDEGSSIGPGPYSDEENDIDEQPQGGAASIGNDSATGGASSIGNDSATGGASSIGNGSATGGMDLLDSDLSEDEDGPQTDRFGFLGGKQYTGGSLYVGLTCGGDDSSACVPDTFPISCLEDITCPCLKNGCYTEHHRAPVHIFCQGPTHPDKGC